MARRELAEAHERGVRDSRDADALAGRRRVARSADAHGARAAALPDDRSLDTHISNLRRKLGSDDDADVLIRSIRGSGYVLVPPEA